MSYRQGSYKSPLAGAGIVIAIVLAIRFLVTFGSAMNGGSLSTTADVERALFRDPQTGPLYHALQRTYPDEFDLLTQDVVRHAKAGETQNQINEAIMTDLIEAGKRHRREVMQAPHESLAAYRSSEIKVVEALRGADIDLCAKYIMTGAVRSESLQNIQGSLIAFRIATWEASAAGRDRPANRTIAAPSPEDIEQLGRRMVVNGTSQAMVTAFFSDDGLTHASPQQQCAAGLSFYRAIDQMPDEKADQFYTYLISRNV